MFFWHLSPAINVAQVYLAHRSLLLYAKRYDRICGIRLSLEFLAFSLLPKRGKSGKIYPVNYDIVLLRALLLLHLAPELSWTRNIFVKLKWSNGRVCNDTSQDNLICWYPPTYPTLFVDTCNNHENGEKWIKAHDHKTVNKPWWDLWIHSQFT